MLVTGSFYTAPLQFDGILHYHHISVRSDANFKHHLLTFNNSGACFFSFSIFHSFSHGLSEDGGAVHEHLQSDPELTVSTV